MWESNVIGIFLRDGLEKTKFAVDEIDLSRRTKKGAKIDTEAAGRPFLNESNDSIKGNY